MPLPEQRRRAVFRFGRLVLVVLMLISAAHRTEAADQTLLLDVQVNGYALGKIGEFTLRDGVLLSQRAELRDLGIKVADSLAAQPDGLIALSDLLGLTWRIDNATQTLYIQAVNKRLLPTLLTIDGAASGGAVESGTGTTLNYDLTGTSAAGQTTTSGLLDMRVFSPWGIVSTGVLAYSNGGPGGPRTNSATRLDSTYTFSDPAALRRYRLGDFIAGGPAWTRPIRLGGIQVVSDFSLRPDLVTFPLPSVSGAVAVPSTVDVLVNGNKMLSRQVAAGPFQIPQLPVVTGAGTIAMSLTNALGRQVNVELPFYASTDLLDPGLQTFAAQAGLVRRNWGVISNDYTGAAATGFYRLGLTQMITVETSAEATAGAAMAGAGVAVNVANLAILNLAAAGSSGTGISGKLLSAGIERAGQVFSAGVSAIVADHDFRDVASMSGDPVPRLQLNANAGLSLGRFGSFGVAYAAIDRDAVPNPVRIVLPPGALLAQNEFAVDGIAYLQPAQHAHVLSASYSVQVSNASVYITGFRDFAAGGSTGVLFGMTIPLGSRSSVNLSAASGTGSRYAQMQATQSAVKVGDWGYQAYAAEGSQSHEFAQLQYMTPWSLLTVGADRVDRQTSARVEAQGAVSWIDGGLFPSNTINDSFAVVDTNGLKNVRVLSENRDSGLTNASGKLLVPDLRAFELNHLSIEPNDVPPDTTIGFTSRDVRPQDRSGIVVGFGVKVSHGALLRLVDDAGKPVEVGSTATLKATGVADPVGFDGEAYAVDLSPHNELSVDRPDGSRCVAVFDYQPIAGDIPTIGPIPCREQHR